MNFLLLLAFLEVSFSRENCLDSLNSKPEMIDTVFSRKINYKSRFLMERESIHEPIRIHIHYGDMDLTPEMDHYIKTSVVQGAIN